MNAQPSNPNPRLHHELSRLYLVGDSSTASLVDEEGLVRALVIELRSPADWKVLSAAWHGVQAELEWPAPAIAVSGTEGIQIWFSLAEAVEASQASALLTGLRLKFLNSVLPSMLRMFPSEDNAPDPVRHAMLVPALQESNGNEPVRNFVCEA